MNIEVENIKGLDNIITHKKKPVPKSTHPDFPVNLFFTYCSFGMKNSGKSYSIVKLLSLFEKFPVKDADGDIMINRVIWFSPTANFSSNSIVHTLKSLDTDNDIYENVSEQVLSNVFEEIKKEKELLKKMCVLFIGTQFSNLDTAVDTPARGRVGVCVVFVCKYE